MASDLSFVEFIVEQMGNSGFLSFKKMFGEYAIYYDRKVIALLCDNQLFLKPTGAGRKMIDMVDEAPPYPGAKLYFRITEHIDDRDWLQELVLVTAKELPEPKPKKRK
jgi:TfoX/Sxy family transcriptional regulator of competence genes